MDKTAFNFTWRDMFTHTVLGVGSVIWYISISYADWGWFSVEYQHVICHSDIAMQLLVHKFTGMNVCYSTRAL